MSQPYNKEFYRSFIDQQQTKEVPSSWYLVVADIKGSTRAAQEGRYQEINYVGAAAIAALRNAFGGKKIPFVFGGDGATFLVSPEKLERVLSILNKLKDVAQKQMGFHLRVEAIQVGKIQDQGATIRFGFVSVGPSEGFHFFRGNGIALAETMLKNGGGEKFKIDSLKDQPNLEGLSCRVSHFPPSNGEVLNLIIEPRTSFDEEDGIFEEIISVHTTFVEFSPMKLKNHSRPWVSSKFLTEARMGGKYPFLVLVENLLTKLIFKFNIKNPVVGNPRDYTEALLIQSDWIKMDGLFRMVLDVDKKTKEQLLSQLELLSAQGKIIYGISHSDDVVMTCHLISGRNQEHIHFVDGSGCGLNRAAQALKEKKAKEEAAEFQSLGPQANSK